MKRYLKIGASFYLLFLVAIATVAFLKIGLYESVILHSISSIGGPHDVSDSFALRCMAAPLVGLPCALVPLVLWFIPKVGKSLWFVVATLLASWAVIQIHQMAWTGQPPVFPLDRCVLAWGLMAYATETLWQLAFMLGNGDGGIRKRVKRPKMVPASSGVPALSIPCPNAA